ncbi:MAG: T9SS type A sorting domain-containing protein [Bacteroidia bacterium]
MRTLLTLSIIGFAAIINAQPVLNSSHIPTAGSVLTFGSAAVSPAFPLNPGANQTWNFTNGTPDEALTLEFLNTSAVPAAASVPGCNFVLKSSIVGTAEEGYYQFSSLSPNGWLSLGSTMDINIVEEIYTTPETILQLPIAMGSSYATTNSNSNSYYIGTPEADSIKYISTTNSIHSTNAHGSLTINGMPYQALLQTIESTYIDSNFTYLNGVYTFQGESTSSETHYQFLAPSVGGFLMIIYPYTDDQGNPTWDVTYMQSNTITSAEKTVKAEAFLLYPNPASSSVNISLPNSGNHVIQIADISGKIVRSINTAFESTVSIDISDIAKGMYFVNLPNTQVTTGAKQKLIIQ